MGVKGSLIRPEAVPGAYKSGWEATFAASRGQFTKAFNIPFDMKDWIALRLKAAGECVVIDGDLGG